MLQEKRLSKVGWVSAWLVIALLVMVGTGCNAGTSTPTPTQALEVPTATAEAPTAEAPTTTAANPTDTIEPAASPTSEATQAPTQSVNLADLQWKQAGLAGTALQ